MDADANVDAVAIALDLGLMHMHIQLDLLLLMQMQMLMLILLLLLLVWLLLLLLLLWWYLIVSVCFVSYQNCDLSLVLITMSIWPDAIPRSVPFDYAIAIKASASTNPPHPNRSVEY